jgi:hypothetical protein
MLGWLGFWIALCIGTCSENWRFIQRKKLQAKYPELKFKWYEY